MNNSLRIATRKSPLAWCQAEQVKSSLEALNPSLQVELIGITTEGDIRLDQPLSALGGKGLFIKEIQQCLLDKRADIAVHSIKDMPMETPDALSLAAITQRASPLDALVSNRYPTLEAMPAGALVGTCSLRRRALLGARFPHLQVVNLRGNVGTRLKKLDSGELDALVLACAGLIRLQMEDRILQALDATNFLPAIGQGALGIECRQDAPDVQALLLGLHDTPSANCVLAERAFNRRLNGGCHAPIAALASCEGDKLSLDGLVASLDGQTILRATRSGLCADAESLGEALADTLIERGAWDILRAAGVLDAPQSV